MQSSGQTAAAPGIELGAVVRESEQMTFEERFESRMSCLHALFGFFKFFLIGQYVGKTPIDLRIANRHDSPEQFFRLAEVSFRRANLGQMHSRFRVHWQDRDCLPVPLGCK